MPPLNPHYSNNEQFITSCTHRLLQLQNELETQHLKQELISSLTMKELSLRKLIEQQDLLIRYLKDELKELKIKKSQGIQMEATLVEMEEKYLALGQLKSLDLVANEKILLRLKTEYHDLHQILNQLTKQSSTLYQLKLKLAQTNSFTKNLLTEKILQFCQFKEKQKIESHINSTKKQQKALLQTQNDKIKLQNVNLVKKLESKRNQLESNKLKLLNLESELKKYEEQKEKLIQIEKAAQNDNLVLKQTLKNKIQSMKQKERSVDLLKQQKQSLTSQKLKEKQRLNDLVKQNNKAQNNLENKLNEEQSLKSQYQILLKKKATAQTELQSLQEKRMYLLDTKQANLKSCLQKQENVEKNLYFIDQYMLINSELINEIKTLLNEEINKQAISSIHLKRQQSDRQYQILCLKDFLSRANQEIYHTQRNVQVLVRDFHNYKIQ